LAGYQEAGRQEAEEGNGAEEACGGHGGDDAQATQGLLKVPI